MRPTGCSERFGGNNAVLHTGGKTDEQIRGDFGNHNPSQKEIDLAKAQAEAWDGHRCILMVAEFYGPGIFAYCGPMTPEDDEQGKNAVYLMEQDSMFGQYIDDRARFDRDYDSGDYSPAGSITFHKDDVEIIE